MLREKLKQRGVPQIFFEISAMGQVFGKNLRYRQTVPAKMPGEFEESDILFAPSIENANCRKRSAGKTDDLAARSAELATQRLYPLDQRVEMSLK